MKRVIFSLFILILSVVMISGCGVSTGEYNALISERDQLITERDSLKASVQDLQEVYPLRGFETVSEFKDWISKHVQPETIYYEDSLLGCIKVQEAAQSDGYLMGISVDMESWASEESGLIGVTTFVGNELYWWFVEDDEMYFGLDMYK